MLCFLRSLNVLVCSFEMLVGGGVFGGDIVFVVCLWFWGVGVVKLD